jgi:hypothetical protein
MSRRVHRPLPSSFGEFKLKAFVILLGCGLLATGCVSDSDGNDKPRHHRHGGGNNRERMETVDHSDTPTPSPSPSRLY